MKNSILIILLSVISSIFSQSNVDLQFNSLDNGLKYVVVENKKLPLVQVRVIFNGGSRLDPDKNHGLTYLTSQLLLKGTTRRSAKQIAEEFEFLGSTIDINTNYDYTILSTEFLKYNFEAGMNILAEIITSPAFDGNEIDKEKDKLISELKSSLENPSYIANQFFNKFIFEGHPYSRLIKGTIKQVEKVSGRQIRNHYKNFFIPNETLIILYGDINKIEADTLISKLFTNWQKGNKIILENSPLKRLNESRIILINKPGLTQAQIRVGSIGINQNNPDEIPISIINTILGDGFTSRLVEEIRVKRSLTYGVRSSFLKFEQGGNFVVSTFTKNQTVGEVIKIILEELKKINDQGVSDWQINKAKNYLIGEYSRQLQSPEGFVDYLSQIVFYKKNLELLTNFTSIIKNTSKEKIRHGINQYFPVKDFLILIVGDARKIKSQLEKFGEINQIEYSILVE